MQLKKVKMKNILKLLIYLFTIYSYSQKNCIETFLLSEKNYQSRLGNITILYNLKQSKKEIINILEQVDMYSRELYPKSINKEEIESLKRNINQKKHREFWNKNDLKKFNLDILNKENYRANTYKLQGEYCGKVLFISLSDPYYLKSKNKVVFNYTESKGSRQFIGSWAIVMEKKLDKWILIEKIVSQRITD